jgi:hypothetical protein
MINSDIKTVCIKRMKDIIGVYGENSNLIQVSKENIEKTLQKIADVRITANVVFSTTVKHALYNLENFRPEIRSAFELQLFNVWYNAFKTGDIEPSDAIEPEILPPVVMEISEVEEIVEEPAAAKEPEPEVEEIVGEPAAAKEPEPEVEEIVGEQAAAKEPEPEVEEIVEEPVAAEEPEPEVEEILEEPIAVEDPELLEKETPIKSVEEQERQTVEKRSEILEQSLDQVHEEEVSLKRHKRDWFDLILDISAAVMKFFIRILCNRQSRK